MTLRRPVPLHPRHGRVRKWSVALELVDVRASAVKGFTLLPRCNSRHSHWSKGRSGRGLTWPQSHHVGVSPRLFWFSAGQYATACVRSGPLPFPTRIEADHVRPTAADMTLARADFSFVGGDTMENRVCRLAAVIQRRGATA